MFIVMLIGPDRPSYNTPSRITPSRITDDAIATALMSFAAKSAILDFGDWTEIMRDLMKGNWNSDGWFYTFPDGDGTTSFRPPTANIPHHQGRNTIPIFWLGAALLVRQLKVAAWFIPA